MGAEPPVDGLFREICGRSTGEADGLALVT